jgi:hypothetical protein
MTPFASPGDSVVVDVDMQPFVNISNSGPGYQFDGQLLTFGAPNFTLDAELLTIVAPSNNSNVKRYNPVCNSPIIVIRNSGSTSLTSLTITYGVTGATASTYTWTGNLAFLETDTVILPTTDWFGTAATFSVTISNPNLQADQYADNNSLSVPYLAPPVYIADLVFECMTNNYGWENSYTLIDANGNIMLDRNSLASNTMYRDTVHLAPGCYIFRHYDSGKDGLNWWANPNAGGGYTRIKKATTGAFVKLFNADFGTAIYQEFTVGYNIGEEEQIEVPVLEVYPNPTSGQVTIDFQSADPEVEIVVYDFTGRIVSQQTVVTQAANNLTIDLSGNAPGLYMIQMRTSTGVVTKKVVLQ